MLVFSAIFFIFFEKIKESNTSNNISALRSLGAMMPAYYQSSSSTNTWNILLDHEGSIRRLLGENKIDASGGIRIHDDIVCDGWNNPILYHWKASSSHPTLLSFGPTRDPNKWILLGESRAKDVSP